MEMMEQVENFMRRHLRMARRRIEKLYDDASDTWTLHVWNHDGPLLFSVSIDNEGFLCVERHCGFVSERDRYVVDTLRERDRARRTPGFLE